jgi:hypothetical protein
MLSGPMREEYLAGVPTEKRSKGRGTAVTVWEMREREWPLRGPLVTATEGAVYSL